MGSQIIKHNRHSGELDDGTKFVDLFGSRFHWRRYRETIANGFYDYVINLLLVDTKYL